MPGSNSALRAQQPGTPEPPGTPPQPPPDPTAPPPFEEPPRPIPVPRPDEPPVIDDPPPRRNVWKCRYSRSAPDKIDRLATAGSASTPTS